MSLVAGCYSCDQEAAAGSRPPSERIWVGPGWRVAHTIHCALPGWVVLVPRRHVETMAELTDAEAVELGRLQIAVSRALHEVVGCEKTYVMQFAEAQGFAHTHVHVVPRAADLADDRLGPDIFWYLERPESEWLDRAAMDALADALTPVVARTMAGGFVRPLTGPIRVDQGVSVTDAGAIATETP